jgi:hypothetical protein
MMRAGIDAILFGCGPTGSRFCCKNLVPAANLRAFVVFCRQTSASVTVAESADGTAGLRRGDALTGGAVK